MAQHFNARCGRPTDVDTGILDRRLMADNGATKSQLSSREKLTF
jgi:hypothetical protein